MRERERGPGKGRQVLPSFLTRHHSASPMVNIFLFVQLLRLKHKESFTSSFNTTLSFEEGVEAQQKKSHLSSC